MLELFDTLFHVSFEVQCVAEKRKVSLHFPFDVNSLKVSITSFDEPQTYSRNYKSTKKQENKTEQNYFFGQQENVALRLGNTKCHVISQRQNRQNCFCQIIK